MRLNRDTVLPVFSYAVLTRVGRTGSQTLFSALSWWGFRLWSLSAYVNFRSGKVSYLSYNLMVSTPHLDPPDAVVVEVTSPSDTPVTAINPRLECSGECRFSCDYCPSMACSERGH